MKKIMGADTLRGLIFWQGWHPEVALRYLPVASELKKLGSRPSVLDVGSGGLGIAPYIGFKVTGIDVRFKPPYHKNLERIKASAVRIPFADNVFDAVIAVDAFEHLTSLERQKAVKEMLRVARKVVIVAVPTGKKSYEQDRELASYYRKKFGKKYRFFEEQLKLGLPEESDMTDAIKNAAVDLNLKFRLKILDNENLKLRKFLMKGWMTSNFLTDVIFRKLMLAAVPIFLRFNNPPVYRKIYVVYKT